MDEAKLVEALADRDSAVQDRETAQKQLAEQRKAVQRGAAMQAEWRQVFEFEFRIIVHRAGFPGLLGPAL